MELEAGKKNLKRQGGPHRAHTKDLPVPADYLTRLELTFGLRQAQKRPKKKAERLWTWSRVRGWQIVKELMAMADIA